MIEDVVPSFYGGSMPMSGAAADSPFNNVRLRIGEVIEVIYPDDKRSLTKTFPEYRVLVQHRANGTAVTQEYSHCLLANPFGSLADFMRYSLRIDSKAGKDGKPGKGTKVLIMCLNGERSTPFIISGARDQTDARENKDKAKKRGHYFEFEFNGMYLEVDDKGQLQLKRKGPTTNEGVLDEKKAKPETVGQTVRLTEDGSVVITTWEPTEKPKDGEPIPQRVVLDHKNRKVLIEADQGWEVTVVGDTKVTTKGDVTIESTEKNTTVRAKKGKVVVSAPKGKIELGPDADEPAVLGDELVSVLKDILKACKSITVPTGTGPSGIPINGAQFDAVDRKLSKILSKLVFVKKDKA